MLAASAAHEREPMDPDANLREQLQVATRLANGKGRPGDGERLADLVEALDNWISGGGFLPTRWAAAQGTVRP